MSLSTVLLTAALLGAAVSCLVAAARIVRELRHLQTLTTSPRLVLDIEADDDTDAVVTITNVGTGPAFDTALTIELRDHDINGDDQPPHPLPHRFHTARVLPPGAQVRFPPPGAPTTGYLDPTVLAAHVRAIHLSGTATDLRGDQIDIHDVLTDPFRRLHTILPPSV